MQHQGNNDIIQVQRDSVFQIGLQVESLEERFFKEFKEMKELLRQNDERPSPVERGSIVMPDGFYSGLNLMLRAIEQAQEDGVTKPEV